MLPGLRNDEKGFTLIELIIVIVILGIISAVAIPKFLSLADSARTAAARGIGSALSASLSNKHAAYLVDGTSYTANECVFNTQFSGSVTIQAATATPGDGRVAAATTAAGNTTIALNYKTKIFQWTFTANTGDTAAFLTETGGNW